MCYHRYNSKSEETTWHVPPEVERAQRLRLDPAKAKMLVSSRDAGNQPVQTLPAEHTVACFGGVRSSRSTQRCQTPAR